MSAALVDILAEFLPERRAAIVHAGASIAKAPLRNAPQCDPARDSVRVHSPTFVEISVHPCGIFRANPSSIGGRSGWPKKANAKQHRSHINNFGAPTFSQPDNTDSSLRQVRALTDVVPPKASNRSKSRMLPAGFGTGYATFKRLDQIKGVTGASSCFEVERLDADNVADSIAIAFEIR